MSTPHSMSSSNSRRSNTKEVSDENAKLLLKGELLLKQLAKLENPGKNKMVKIVSNVEKENDVLRVNVLRKEREVFQLSKSITKKEKKDAKLMERKKKENGENRDLKSKIQNSEAEGQKYVKHIKKLKKDEKQLQIKQQGLKNKNAPANYNSGQKKSKKAITSMTDTVDDIVESVIFEFDDAQSDLEGFKTVNLFAEYWEIPQLKTKLDESPEEKKAAQEALNSWMDEHVPAQNWKTVPKIPTAIESEDSNSFNVKIANNTEDIGASASLPPSRKRNRTKKSGTAEPKPQPQLHRGNISSISAALAPPEVIAKQEEEMDSQRRMLKVFQNLHTDMVLPQTPSAAKRPRIAKYYF